MKMNIVFASLIFLLALNCKPAENQAKLIKESTDLISKGNLYGSGNEGIQKQNLVIENQNDWNTLLKKLDSVNNVSESFSEIDIDFSKYTVIAVFDEVKNSGGYSLDLNIQPDSENITVEIIRKSPEGMVSTVITQPYHIVKILKSDLPIRFE